MRELKSADLDALRAEIRSSLSSAAPKPGWREAYMAMSDDERRAFDDRHRKALKEAGWLAAHWPPEFGGRGLSAAQDTVLKIELQRLDFPPVERGIGFHHAAATLIQHGTPQQQARLAAILDGEIWCQGFSEPGAGSDLASVQTKAVRDGQHYVVNGQKVWSSEAHLAKWCLLLARTDSSAPKHKGISLFMMDMSSPGVEIRPIREAATGASHFNEIFLNDVHIPVENLLGPENEGWRVAQTTLANERMSFMVSNHAQLANAVGDLCAEAARIPWGRSGFAIDDGGVRAELADCAAEVEVLGMLIEKVIGGVVEHGEVGPEGSVLKLFYSEALQKLTGLGTRLRGTESWIEGGIEAFASVSGNWAVDHIGSWVWTISAGTNEIQRNIIGERVLGLPREPTHN